MKYSYQLLHTNDLHNHFPLRTLSLILRKEALLFDSGDAIAGSNTVFRHQEPILTQMREMGYHAMAMGNREFHYLRKVLLNRMEAANFPILSSNVIDLKKIVKIQDSLNLTLRGIKIGVFALTVPQYPVGSPWEKITGWRFLDPFKAASVTLEKLRQAGSSLVFCLSHLGFQWDQRLAENCKGLDIILGGHSHTVLPEIYWKDKTAILQGGSHGRFVGNFELEFTVQDDKLKDWTLQGGLVKTND